ncbi:helix-turn-helix domain-containing protein [Vibrio alginolyticus]|nr:helix-turn-helix domain-containing protein [Vibrio alginolyticus]
MKATTFGKYLRTLRIKKEILLKEMAEVLGISSAYLSALELGKKAISESLVEKIIEKYELNAYEASELKSAASVSQPNVKIDLVGKSNEEREMVVSFARKYESLTDAQREQMRKIMEI